MKLQVSPYRHKTPGGVQICWKVHWGNEEQALFQGNILECKAFYDLHEAGAIELSEQEQANVPLQG